MSLVDIFPKIKDCNRKTQNFYFCKISQVKKAKRKKTALNNRAIGMDCIYQQLPQRGGAAPDPVWIGTEWLLAFPQEAIHG